MRIQSYIPLVCLFLAYPILAKDKLIFAIDMIRHGDRTPLIKLEAIDYTWKEGLGQLTPLGMDQELALGAKLRQRYVVEESLLPPHYDGKTLYVHSTDTDRTLMSAQAFLMGLYPVGTGPMRGGYQPIPIHSYPKKYDALIPNAAQEKALHAMLHKYVYASPEWQEKTKQTQAKWPEWAELTGKKIENLHDVVRLGNTLHIYQRHQIPLPAKLTKEDINIMIEIGHWGTAAKYRPTEIGSLIGKPQLKTIFDYLNAASKKQSALSYVLLSAHDGNLMSIMNALGAPLEHAPPYASHLSFGLYETEQNKQIIIVRYNDEIVHLSGCDKQGCTLVQFMQKVS